MTIVVQDVNLGLESARQGVPSSRDTINMGRGRNISTSMLAELWFPKLLVVIRDMFQSWLFLSCIFMPES